MNAQEIRLLELVVKNQKILICGCDCIGEEVNQQMQDDLDAALKAVKEQEKK